MDRRCAYRNCPGRTVGPSPLVDPVSGHGLRGRARCLPLARPALCWTTVSGQWRRS